MTLSRHRPLSWAARLTWLVVNLVLAMVPTLLFFAWIALDTRIPWVPEWLGWPWIQLPTASPVARTIWNAGLYVPFAFLHTGLAQLRVQDRMRQLVPAPAVRTFYLTITAWALLAMMGLWQPTGVVLWRLPLTPAWEMTLMVVTFAVPMLVILSLLGSLGFAEFLGWSQLFTLDDPAARTAGMPALRTGGIYGYVRHPIYTGLLAMFLLGPTLSLDRFTVFAVASLYLAVGIPIEERKLVKLFGPAYLEYARHVPALLPGLRFGRHPATTSETPLPEVARR